MKLFRKQEEPSCQTCLFGKRTADQSYILCRHKGVMVPYDHCRKYRYSPLHRIPRRRRPLTSFSQEDFSL